MIIRKYKPLDCKELTELFYNTVHTVNGKDYTKEQLNVWATGKVDLEKWNKSLQEHYSLVVIENYIIIGFGDIDKTGYIDRLYVHKDYQGKGVATAICDKLE
ncbi:acetyltransferase [Clostridium botulinum E1 str. 'BoNT E Beluga']|nr:acetyltransferase [Clostridium botulinum E1 str. 'BoNT E Beluga']